MKNSLNSEATRPLKRKGNIATLTIAGFLFIFVNSLGYFRRAIFFKEGKVCSSVLQILITNSKESYL